MLDRYTFSIGCCALHAPEGRSWTQAKPEFVCGTVDMMEFEGAAGMTPFAAGDAWDPVAAAQAGAAGMTPYGTINLAHRWRSTDGLTPGTGVITLGVHFLNGTADEQAVVERGARMWLSGPFAALFDFKFGVPQSQAQISVLFGREGNSSIVGRTSANYAHSQATMHIEDVVDYVVAHEFGHALGLQHEHQNPNLAIVWKKQVVIDEMAKQGWTEKMCEDNIFNRFTRSYACLGSKIADTQSIMMYPIPERWAENFQSGENTQISADDFQCLSGVYRS